jgi:cell wall-associated NlpC family hydrolase
MTNQLVLGEVVELTDRPRPEWYRVRAPDGYEGFTTSGSLRLVAADDAAAWTAAADGFSLGVDLHDPSSGDGAGAAPWGARLPSAGGRGDSDSAARELLLLPDGQSVAAVDPKRIVFGPRRALDYAADPAAALETAHTWMGAPYHWGGRIREGTDCSGLVQAVYSLHGFRLKRDSRRQFEAGPQLPPSCEHAVEGRPGDLWFFAWDGEPVSHVGICIGGGEMLHASETRGRVAIDRLGEGEFGRELAAGLVGGVRPEA